MATTAPPPLTHPNVLAGEAPGLGLSSRRGGAERLLSGSGGAAGIEKVSAWGVAVLVVMVLDSVCPSRKVAVTTWEPAAR
jgi:hypothetical protein